MSVTIGVPISQERISPVLDAATRLLVVTRRRGREIGRRECTIEPLPPDHLARSLAELGIEVLLCAALSEPLQQALRREQVRVHSHVCGDVDSVLQAFCNHQLARAEFRMPGCRGRHVEGRCQRRTSRSRGGQGANPRKSQAA